MKKITSHEGENLNLILAVGVIAIVIIMLSMSGCTGPEPTGNETTNETVNETINETPVKIAEPGGVVEVNYKGTLENGTIFDESKDNPLKFTIGTSPMITGFVEAVVGMKEGETKNVTIPPEKAYGNYDPNKIQKTPKASVNPRDMDIPLSGFKQVTGKDPVLNDTHQIPQLAPWPVKVIGITNTTVNIQHEPLPDMVVDIGLGKVTAVTVNETNLILTSNPVVGTKINTQSGTATIIGVDATDITMDYNHHLAGKTLHFEITLVKILDACESLGISKSDKPKAELHIFSYCPAGSATLDVFAPVGKLLSGKVDLKVKFFSNMHGDYEKQQNMIQECIQVESPDKYWDYALEFKEKIYAKCGATRDIDCDKDESIKLMNEVGIDSGKVMECVETRGEELYSQDKADAAALSLRYSPSIVIQGKYLSNVDRTPTGIQKAICCAFNEKPAECSQELDNSGSVITGAC